MDKKKRLVLLLESGDAVAQAVPDEDSDVYVGNEITSFCLVVSREIVEYWPPNE